MFRWRCAALALVALVALSACGGTNDGGSAGEERSSARVDPACKAPDPAVVKTISGALTSGKPNTGYTVKSKEISGLSFTSLYLQGAKDVRPGKLIGTWATYKGKVYSASGFSLRLTPELPNVTDNTKLLTSAYDNAAQKAFDCVDEAHGDDN